MITITDHRINHIPTIIVSKHTLANQPLPTVIYFHGFTSAKEHNLPFAHLLAKENYRVILPDSKWHGERENNISETKKQLSFWEIVLENIKDAERIKDYLDEQHLITEDRFGVAGTSMGGVTTAALLATYDWIKAAAILMGSPKITTFARWLLEQFPDQSKLPDEKTISELMETLRTYDLSTQLHTLKNRPLLLWHGDADRIVPFDHTVQFYERAKQVYTNEQHLQFIQAPDQDHKVSRAAILKTVAWFKRYL